MTIVRGYVRKTKTGKVTQVKEHLRKNYAIKFYDTRGVFTFPTGKEVLLEIIDPVRDYKAALDSLTFFKKNSIAMKTAKIIEIPKEFGNVPTEKPIKEIPKIPQKEVFERYFTKSGELKWHM